MMHKGSSILSTVDYKLLKYIQQMGKINITAVRNYLGCTHANLTPHLKRLEMYELIIRERDKQTIYLKIKDVRGELVLNIFGNIQTEILDREIELLNKEREPQSK